MNSDAETSKTQDKCDEYEVNKLNPCGCRATPSFIEKENSLCLEGKKTAPLLTSTLPAGPLQADLHRWVAGSDLAYLFDGTDGGGLEGHHVDAHRLELSDDFIALLLTGHLQKKRSGRDMNEQHFVQKQNTMDVDT